jgi:hypothetical protein
MLHNLSSKREIELQYLHQVMYTTFFIHNTNPVVALNILASLESKILADHVTFFSDENNMSFAFAL